MVQKENQQSNVVTRNTPDGKKRSSNGADKENPVADKNSLNNDVQCRQKNPGMSVNKTKGVGKRNRKSEFDAGKSVDIKYDESEVPYNIRNIRNAFGVQFSAASFVAGWVNRTFSKMFGGCTVETVMNKCRCSEAVAGVRDTALYAIRTATIWLEQLQPQLKSVASVIRNGQKYVRAKVGHAYPIIFTRAVFFLKLVFLLSMVWLDCAIRGLDSLLRLGSTSFFTVIWCSIISVYAMIGFTKMLVITVCLLSHPFHVFLLLIKWFNGFG